MEEENKDIELTDENQVKPEKAKTISVDSSQTCFN